VKRTRIAPSDARRKLAVVLWVLLGFSLAAAWRPERIWLSIFQCGVLVSLCVWIVLIWRRGLPVERHPAMWVMAALPLFGLLQLLLGKSVYPWQTATATLDWSVLAALGWLALQACALPDAGRIYRNVLVGVAAVVGAVSLLHWFTSPGLILWFLPNPYEPRATFPLLNHSHFAALIELALGPAVWDAMRQEHGSRPRIWIVALMTASVWAAGSRSGAAIVTVEIVALVWLSMRLTSAKAFHRRRAAAITLSCLVLVAGFGWQEFVARSQAGTRDDLRMQFSAASIDMIRARPLAGFGLGTWEHVYPAYARIDPGLYVEHAHDDWLEWAAEGGVGFSAAMLLLAGLALRRSFEQPWSLGIVCMFLQGLAEFPLHKPAVLAVLFSALGCLFADRGHAGVELQAR
jgi:O-antigen ligase